MLTYDHANRASQGARPYQEDSAAIWPSDDPLTAGLPAALPSDTTVLAVLADGMGGHVGGALASNLVCTTLLETYAKGKETVSRRLAMSLDAANQAIRRKGTANPQLMGMGATAVGVAFCPDGAHWISVGDSPLYLYRKGELTRVNEDHSLAPLLDKLAADGKMDPEEAKNDHRRHYLRSALELLQQGASQQGASRQELPQGSQQPDLPALAVPREFPSWDPFCPKFRTR